MKIELLHIAECPSWSSCLKNIRHALIDLDDDSKVNVYLLDASDKEGFSRFHGSPTILVDGQDIFPIDDYDGALSCRVYSTPEGRRGMPSVDQIVEKLRSIRNSH